MPDLNLAGSAVQPYMFEPTKGTEGEKSASGSEEDSVEYRRRASLEMSHASVVRDSSAVRRLLWTCCSRGTSESSTYGKQQIFPPTLGQHISTFRGYLILFSIRNPCINHFTNHFSIHS